MRMEDMILISVDDHIIEPPDLFTNHISQKYKDEAPKVVTLPNGQERWTVEGKLLATVGSSAVAGRSREERHLEPANYAHMRKGCYDVDARVDDQNANGVLASANFATLPGFSGELFLKGNDKDLMLACVRAYNDWHLEDWAGKHPAHFIPIVFSPLWDVNLAVEEIHRAAKKGAKAFCFPENATAFGLPSVHSDYWDPVFKACCEHDLVVCVHIGTGGGFRYTSLDSPAAVAITTMNITLADVTADLLYSPIFTKFPDIKFALSEGYMGWVPFFKERADFVQEFHGYWTGVDFGDQKPSDVIRKHFLLCFTEDPVGIKCRHDIGLEMITWECDYPHADSTWPLSPERLWRQLEKLPENEINMITHENAMRYFNFDPFKYIDRTGATVGALRATAKHVNVTPKSDIGGFKPSRDIRGVVTFRDLANLAKEMDLALLDNQSATSSNPG
jgi:predicted TIM-barrel fold metal-dependent hydrolase